MFNFVLAAVADIVVFNLQMIEKRQKQQSIPKMYLITCFSSEWPETCSLGWKVFAVLNDFAS
jgi:hypothetical protein